ncbi:MAG TPA: type II toxin-antitoxin system Phd/YefM family antitoxin [Candidatus Fraserbacteria bacterium]|nr:type II toxin-antitoxin system Phd/YefM family antitoxin [Candidatus Fraserbacteria bacterium]
MSTRKVSLAEAKNKLTELVRQVEAGEQVMITKRHKPAARLLSEAQYEQLQKKLAVAGLRALRKRFRSADLKGKEFYEEARRLLEERA